jgi:hypothetical protein
MLRGEIYMISFIINLGIKKSKKRTNSTRNGRIEKDYNIYLIIKERNSDYNKRCFFFGKWANYI